MIDRVGLDTMIVDCFPYCIDVDPDEVLPIVGLLMNARDGVPNGSSFMVDSNAPPWKRRIWLSETSLATLKHWMGER